MNSQTLSDDQKLLLYSYSSIYKTIKRDIEMLLQKSRDFGQERMAIMDLNLWLNVKLQILSAIDILHMVRVEKKFGML